MNPAEALLHAARRHCVDEAARWRDEHAAILERAGDDLFAAPVESEEELRVYPRYQVLDAILAAVERVPEASLADLASVRAALVAAGAGARSAFAEGGGDVERAVMEEERARFLAFVAGMDETALARVEPLPHRRRLGSDEEEGLRRRLRERWGVTGSYWFPLDRDPDAPPPPDAEAFAAERFAAPQAQEDLRAAIASLGVARLFELGEDPGRGAEIDLALLVPVYDLDERFWLPADAAWVVYASHESTVTVAGAPLLRAFRARARP